MADWLSMVCLNLREMLPPGALYYMTKHEAIGELKKLSGDDFGEDVEAWLQWVERYKARIRRKVEEEMEQERRQGQASDPAD